MIDEILQELAVANVGREHPTLTHTAKSELKAEILKVIGDDNTGGLTELDIKLLQLESLAYIPRKRGEPGIFDLTELRAFIRQLVLDDRQTQRTKLEQLFKEK